MELKTYTLPCNCIHTYQDTKYGKGMRVHNFCLNHPDKARGGWRCTVCGFDVWGESGQRRSAQAKSA